MFEPIVVVVCLLVGYLLLIWVKSKYFPSLFLLFLWVKSIPTAAKTKFCSPKPKLAKKRNYPIITSLKNMIQAVLEKLNDLFPTSPEEKEPSPLTPLVNVTYGLISNYREQYNKWEILVLLRKLCLTVSFSHSPFLNHHFSSRLYFDLFKFNDQLCRQRTASSSDLNCAASGAVHAPSPGLSPLQKFALQFLEMGTHPTRL